MQTSMKNAVIRQSTAVGPAHANLARRSITVQSTGDLLKATQEGDDDEMIVNPFIANGVINPYSAGNYVRSILVLTLVMVNCIWLPFPAFYDPTVSSDALNSFSTFMDVVFIVDMIMNFFTGFVDNWGTFVYDKKIIRARYLRGNFVWDFLAVLPLEVVGQAFGYTIFTHVFHILRLTRCFRFHRLVTSPLLKSSLIALRLFRLLFIFLLLCHWIGSMFFGIGTTSS